MEKVILIGYGGHAESVVDSIQQLDKYEIVGYTDRAPSKKKILYPYLGDDNMLQELFDKGIKHAVICVGYLGESYIRDMLYDKVKKIGYQLPIIVDKTAILSKSSSIGEGSYIGKGAVVNAKSKIGKMCIINTRAVIEHENEIGDFSHVSVNAVLCGNVFVADHVFIGANSTIMQGKNIQSDSIIGAGSVILNHVPGKMHVYGLWK